MKNIFGRRKTRHYFKDEFGLRRALERIKWSGDIKNAISHERSHFNKAQELGYSPKYGVMIIKTNLFEFRIVSKYALVELDKKASPEDSREISLAPENMGVEDYDKIRNSFREEF